MKTEQKQAVNNYILDCIDLSGHDQYTGIQLSERERLQAVYDIFKSEYGHQLPYYGNNEQTTFVNWLMGLPSCFNVDFENYKILEITKKWGFLKEGASERLEQKVIDEWFARIYMAYRKMLTSKGFEKPKRKTRDIFEVLGDYGQGFEMVTTESTYKECRARLKEYRENEPGTEFTYKKKRERIEV